MIIHRGHMDGLSGYMAQGFEDRMLEHLKKYFPAKIKQVGDEAARQQIRDGVKRAQNYYLRSEREAAKFIDLTFAIHPTFDEQPEMKWAKDILSDLKISGDERLGKVREQLPQRLKALSSGAKA
jgi:hypothetical protein